MARAWALLANRWCRFDSMIACEEASESTIAKYIENKGVGIHHMALACENIEEQLADAEAHGIRLIDKTPRKGAEGLTIAFLHPKSTQGILTELCENKNK